MSVLLEHLTKNAPIYLYEQNFQEYPTLYYQVMVLKNLESGNHDQANASWNYLKQLSPKIYQDNFIYKGDKCLFSLCLAKNLGQKKVMYNITSNSKEDMLIEYLEQSDLPLSSEWLYE